MGKKQISGERYGRKTMYSLERSIPILERWFKSPLGGALLIAQQEVLAKKMTMFRGRHALQLSVIRDVELTKAGSLVHQFAVGPKLGPGISVLCQSDNLPIYTESVDLAVVHHVMEYSRKPHQLLKELTRVILPSGHIVIIGFNPYGLFGVGAVFKRFYRTKVWHNHTLSCRRVADWLSLMGFTVVDVEYGFYKPPINLTTINKRFKWIDQVLSSLRWPLAGFYIITAKKQVAPYTPTKEYLNYLRKSMIPIMEPSLYTPVPNNNVNKNVSDRVSTVNP